MAEPAEKKQEDMKKEDKKEPASDSDDEKIESQGSKEVDVVELDPGEAEELEAANEDGKDDEYEDVPEEAPEEDDGRVLNNAGELLGHKDFITSVSCSPINPDLVATGSGDDSGKTWSLSTSKEIGSLGGILPPL